MTAIVGVHGVGNYVSGQPPEKVASRRSADWAASVAAGPVHGTAELDSRPAPAGVVIARFSTEAAADPWFDAVLGKLDGTTVLTTGATAPVWWPSEKEPERSQWSRRGELPVGRVRPIREIQTSFGPRRSPVPSSPAHPRATGLAR